MTDDTLYKKGKKRKKGKLLISHRSTAYPCYLPVLGEFSRSWSYETCPGAKVRRKKLEPIKERADSVRNILRAEQHIACMPWTRNNRIKQGIEKGLRVRSGIRKRSRSGPCVPGGV